MNNLFNGRGYFVGYGPNTRFRPSFVRGDPENRYRLFEFRPPAESNQIFADGDEERSKGEPQQFDSWYKQALGSVGEGGDFESHLNPLAKNILTLVISPRDTPLTGADGRIDTASEIADDYNFDSNDRTDTFASFSQQVPPLVRMTMVAIDEAAGARFDNGSGSVPDLIPSGLFEQTGKYEEDVTKLGESLSEAGVNYKVFSTMVMLRSAKWSVN